MIEEQADDMITMLKRIAVALERIAACQEQQNRWQAGDFEADEHEDSDEGLTETFRE